MASMNSPSVILMVILAACLLFTGTMFYMWRTDGAPEKSGDYVMDDHAHSLQKQGDLDSALVYDAMNAR